MADRSMSSSTTYSEPPFRYVEGKNQMFCQNIKMNLQDIQRLMDKANTDMTNIKKNLNKTTKMIHLISAAPQTDHS